MGPTLLIPLSLLLPSITGTPEIDRPSFPDGIVAGFEAHCYRCHSGDEVKGGFDLKIVVEDGAKGGSRRLANAHQCPSQRRDATRR